jgi:hypothetical protein
MPLACSLEGFLTIVFLLSLLRFTRGVDSLAALPSECTPHKTTEDGSWMVCPKCAYGPWESQPIERKLQLDGIDEESMLRIAYLSGLDVIERRNVPRMSLRGSSQKTPSAQVGATAEDHVMYLGLNFDTSLTPIWESKKMGLVEA